MTPATYTYRAVWPIIDPDQSLRTLKDQALEDLIRLIDDENLQPAGPPVWHVQHGEKPTLTVTINVTDKERTQSAGDGRRS